MANYTTLTPKELKDLLSHYDLGKLIKTESLEGGQANSSIKLFTERGIFILSICDEKKSADVDCLTRVLLSLEESTIPATLLVKTASGRHQISHNKTPVYLKRFVPGQVTRNLTSAILHQLGSTMATMHRLPAVDGLPEKFPCGLQLFDEVINSDLDHPYLDWLELKKHRLLERLDPEMRKGFIHGDIFWDNLVVRDDTLVAILDFEEACHYYTLFDLGMCAVGCCSKNGKFDLAKIKALMTGYTSRQPLMPEELRQLSIFVEYAAVAASLWRFRQYNINYPDSGKADSYLELSSLADQTATLDTLSSNN
jgi:homoserine kinase type II